MLKIFNGFDNLNQVLLHTTVADVINSVLSCLSMLVSVHSLPAVGIN